ncbi:hypothetical protein AMAG_20043 [Allomyces macrogynus ATCC 38327]|uniref:Uncharacterized protein n=1 Tax=Allomyces macrogynus (strain ATCC 38327) TaxID=578462 RepID=A0A0L0T4Z7_ALLM3|nr:hypothetical protein AMAG_20043 [Allomyces macrogynus ATCC 38327]|eukprot:KNE69781.1 hypothetical protein AMAG_20043 [Allomyces macrogynus ATCC 38327]
MHPQVQVDCQPIVQVDCQPVVHVEYHTILQHVECHDPIDVVHCHSSSIHDGSYFVHHSSDSCDFCGGDFSVIQTKAQSQHFDAHSAAHVHPVTFC